MKFVVSISRKIKEKQVAYKQSEVFYFNKLLKTLNQKSTGFFIRELYIWFDKARKPEQIPAIKNYLLPEEAILFGQITPKKTASSLKKIIRN